ncbi:MAG: AAA family ATPase [Alphaproteobacteria bacterium]|nr:AAA family ATPase [Alphaproteobacteria bacterium]
MRMHSVRVLDLPDHDTDSAPIQERLEAFLTGLRQKRALTVYFDLIEDRKRYHAPDPPPPLTRDDLRDVQDAVGLVSFRGLPRGPRSWPREREPLPGHALSRIRRRVDTLVERRRRANGLTHLRDRDKDQAKRLRALSGAVPAPGLESEDRADEIAAALHEEMPWMAPATEVAWHAFRRSGRLGEPVRLGPMVLVGPPGIGKTHWARRLSDRLGTPSCTIDASQGLASFSVVGTESGWASSQPGRPLDTMLQHRIANPIIVVDELCKASSIRSTAGVSASFLPALLGLLEPESARDWTCPFFKVKLDMRHLSWVMLANTLATVPEPVLSRARVLPIPDVTPAQLKDFARRRAAAMGLEAPAVDAVVETLDRAPALLPRRLSLRDVNRMLERAVELAARPLMH